ncbi:hypothetical protein CWE08_10330 [Aliidiomarina iranensis]|uniref:Uncharacterized protein n=1 Tax=Aliidiomarina iranensis TaxID=1434071 RepID=A0A432VRU7_9GAMM|nr:RHS repeat-associated core domain-containing protein [Aliidiomarina iranensis]RUO18949.1 hypothetical protein CWE08_10330 [Aliidiomarina iranensis]
MYDPWGRQYAVHTRSVMLSYSLLGDSKGYTGHEQVDHASVVQMGGRIYDAHIGRFLQADPFVQSPSNSQNFNRYSYVLSAYVLKKATELH